ncbi:Flavin reductase [uncultured delta proteobacterium]|uniref:Flavin reductase n=1 Tax=uncultured delta proteobacterium TaxID=34034 RepID=A0A212KF80_9DELT|nr:Flavin reductase [uncultured delta proteobacterium]
MKTCILMGSPRKNGNTQAILDPFMEELARRGAALDTFRLYDRKIEPCIACRLCQKDWTVFGCRFNDDVPAIFDAILASDLIVLATPIYSWFCTPPMKALLDRLVYGMNKYYGETKGPSLWAGKNLALVTTCGYRPERGADLFDEALKRYCKHSGLRYHGMLAERDLGYASVFMSEDKAERARDFAGRLWDVCRKVAPPA